MEHKKIIELNNIKKVYKFRRRDVIALDGITLSFDEGKFYAIMGHSGSGKSTLISIIGLLEEITEGIYMINGKDTKGLSDKEEACLRRDTFGFIFQEFCLDPYLKAYENVIMPMLVNNNVPNKERKKKALDLLDLVDLSDRFDHYPKELSGGEQQRVAIARALANDPDLIIADEPTGDLDEDNEEKIFDILKNLSKKGKCVIVVSHSNEVRKYADVVLKLERGKIVKE